IEASGASVDKIMLSLRPPIVELLSRLPRRQRMVPSVVTVPPQPRQIHAPAVLRFHVTRQLVERPKMIVRVDRGNRVEMRLDPAIGRGLPRAGGCSFGWPGLSLRSPGILRGQRGQKE